MSAGVWKTCSDAFFRHMHLRSRIFPTSISFLSATAGIYLLKWEITVCVCRILRLFSNHVKPRDDILFFFSTVMNNKILVFRYEIEWILRFSFQIGKNRCIFTAFCKFLFKTVMTSYHQGAAWPAVGWLFVTFYVVSFSSRCLSHFLDTLCNREILLQNEQKTTWVRRTSLLRIRLH